MVATTKNSRLPLFSQQSRILGCIIAALAADINNQKPKQSELQQQNTNESHCYQAVSALAFKTKCESGTDSLPSQGVSYTVSAITLPTLVNLPSSSSAAHALTSLQSALRLPVLALSSLAAAPLFLSFVLSPRYARHPYLFYTSLLAVLSAVAPSYLPKPATSTSKPSSARKATSSRARMEASYEVLGDSHSEGDLPSESELEDINGEEVRANIDGAARAYLARTGLAAAAFVLSVIGLWGDGAPRSIRYY